MASLSIGHIITCRIRIDNVLKSFKASSRVRVRSSAALVLGADEVHHEVDLLNV